MANKKPSALTAATLPAANTGVLVIENIAGDVEKITKIDLFKGAGATSLAVGTNATATQDYAVAIGSGCDATAAYAFSAGYEATASGQYSSAIGGGCTASAAGALALGNNANASAQNAVALGTGVAAALANSVNIGTKGLVIVESSGLGNPPANSGMLFVEDNGSAKSRLVIKWPDGTTEVLATQA